MTRIRKVCQQERNTVATPDQVLVRTSFGHIVEAVDDQIRIQREDVCDWTQSFVHSATPNIWDGPYSVRCDLTMECASSSS